MSDASQLQICFVSSADEADEITQVVELLEASSGVLGIDTETTGLDPLQNRVRLIQVASEDVALVVDLAAFREGDRRRVDWTRAGLRDLRRLIVGGKPKVIQNAAFDLNFLRGEGLVVGGHIFDTMIASKILNNGHPNKNDLGSIVSRELGWDMPKELQKADWAGELSSEMVLYAARDASALPQLVPPLMEKLKRSRVGEVTLWDVFKLESMCLRPIAAMQWNGFGFDRARGEELRVVLQAKADELMQDLLELMQTKLKARYPDEPGEWLPLNADGSFNTNPKEVGSIRLGTKRYAGFNPRAPQQMVQKLTALGVILPPNEKGKPSMDQNLLAFLRQSSDLIDRYLTWKEADTQVSHIEKLLESVAPDGRIHANYRQVGTDTGRMSCIAEGQRVLAPNGPVPIEDVQIGDYVYSLDSDGAPCVKRVTNKWCNGEQDVVCVTWEAKGHQDPMYGELVCTPDHLLRTDRGWVKAEDIQFKEPVWHLRRSALAGTRPRLYWRNYGYAAEQTVIKESYFGAVGSEWHIHHIDHDKTNNGLANLQIMSRAEHFSHHCKSRHPQMLGIGTRRINELMLEYGIKRSNHRVINVAPAGKRLVYDLEIEDTHNFIVEELCVHNCAGPNLQQVPRGADFRSLFVAHPGHKLVVADFSQIELRVAAELSGEERMLEAYRAGRDLHTETAALITKQDSDKVTKEERTSAKMCFSGDTEVLTDAGWVRLDAYANQRVAQYVLPAGVVLNRSVRKPGPGYVAGLPAAWDGNCGAIEFVEALHYDSFFSEDVWCVVDRNIDIVATSNHQILYLDAYGNAHKKDFSKVTNPREIVAAGYCAKRADCLSATDSRLLAMVVADGSFKQTSGWVSLGFSKRRKIRRCGDLLEEAGIEYKKSTSANGYNRRTTFFKFRLEAAPWLLDYVNKDKVLNHAACVERVDALAYLGEAQYWDGVALGGMKRDRVIIGTTVRETADVMQAMAVTAGLPCTVHIEESPGCTGGWFFRVSYAFRTTPTWRPSWAPERVEAQQVYCVQVPSGLIVIRRNGKVCVQGNCNFGLLFGAGAATLRKQAIAQYGVALDMKEAQALVSGFRSAYPRLYQWQLEEGEGTTTSVYTRYGRRRILVGRHDKFTTRINTQVQGTAGDIAKVAIGKLWEEIGKAPTEARLISMCHDELILEVREEVTAAWEQKLKQAMEDAGALVCTEVPIVADVSSGDTWAEAK